MDNTADKVDSSKGLNRKPLTKEILIDEVLANLLYWACKQNDLLLTYETVIDLLKRAKEKVSDFVPIDTSLLSAKGHCIVTDEQLFHVTLALMKRYTTLKKKYELPPYVYVFRKMLKGKDSNKKDLVTIIKNMIQRANQYSIDKTRKENLKKT